MGKMDGGNEGHGPKIDGSKGGGPKIDGGDKGFILGIYRPKMDGKGEGYR